MAHSDDVTQSNSALETTDESLTVATVLINGSVGLSGNYTLINARTALQFIEKEVYNILRSIGADATLAISLEFEQ